MLNVGTERYQCLMRGGLHSTPEKASRVDNAGVKHEK
jgi:hypothetical protein